MHYPVNVFVGKIRDYAGSRPSAIDKIQVDGELQLGDLGLDGDQQAEKILVFREDIGRHNVFDKLYGWSLRNHVAITDKIIIFSGRGSAEMMMKLGRMGISTVAAKSVPTTLSLALAKKLGITLVARMAPGSFCVYTNPERIVC